MADLTCSDWQTASALLLSASRAILHVQAGCGSMELVAQTLGVSQGSGKVVIVSPVRQHRVWKEALHRYAPDRSESVELMTPYTLRNVGFCVKAPSYAVLILDQLAMGWNTETAMSAAALGRRTPKVWVIPRLPVVLCQRSDLLKKTIPGKRWLREVDYPPTGATDLLRFGCSWDTIRLEVPHG